MATIYLDNKARIEIDLSKLHRIITEAALPTGKIVLVLNDSPLPGNNQGACIPRALLNFSESYAPVCEGDLQSWDVCIAITHKFCLLHRDYPAYFTYLIGHEVGHAKICLADLPLHIHYCLVQEHIKVASNYQITRWPELPHEQRFDQFGIYLSQRLYSRDHLNEEIERLLDRPECNDRDRLQSMLSLSPSDNLDHIRNELVGRDSKNLYKID